MLALLTPTQAVEKPPTHVEWHVSTRAQWFIDNPPVRYRTVVLDDWRVEGDGDVSHDAGFLDEIFRQIREAIDEASFDGWYGPGSVAVSSATLDQAFAFARLLPSRFGAPDIMPDPDGHIAFEWYRAPRLVFTAAVGPSDVIYYAGLIGRSKINGAEPIDTASDTIASCLERLYSEPASS